MYAMRFNSGVGSKRIKQRSMSVYRTIQKQATRDLTGARRRHVAAVDWAPAPRLQLTSRREKYYVQQRQAKKQWSIRYRDERDSRPAPPLP